MPSASIRGSGTAGSPAARETRRRGLKVGETFADSSGNGVQCGRQGRGIGVGGGETAAEGGGEDRLGGGRVTGVGENAGERVEHDEGAATVDPASSYTESW